MMLRDDIYIDETKADLNTNFVAAGIACSSKAILSCENGTLTEGIKSLDYA